MPLSSLSSWQIFFCLSAAELLLLLLKMEHEDETDADVDADADAKDENVYKVTIFSIPSLCLHLFFLFFLSLFPLLY